MCRRSHRAKGDGKGGRTIRKHREEKRGGVVKGSYAKREKGRREGRENNKEKIEEKRKRR